MNIPGINGKKNGKKNEKATPNNSAPQASSTPEVVFGKDVQSDSRAKIGKSLLICGEISGEEDLLVEGQVEGRVDLANHHLLVGEAGKISGEVSARKVTIAGSIEGNIQADERVEIKKSGTLVGDIRASRVVIHDGAKFKGHVDIDGEFMGQEVFEKADKNDSTWLNGETPKLPETNGDSLPK